MTDAAGKSFIDLTANIVSAYLSNNPTPASEIPNLISQIHAALLRVSSGRIEAPAEPAKPAVSLKKSVNPDYLVVPILHPTRPIDAAVLPGNYLAHRLPILTSFYHGTEQVWLGLPFFALLGTSVSALRLVHGLFGCAAQGVTDSRVHVLNELAGFL